MCLLHLLFIRSRTPFCHCLFSSWHNVTLSLCSRCWGVSKISWTAANPQTSPGAEEAGSWAWTQLLCTQQHLLLCHPAQTFYQLTALCCGNNLLVTTKRPQRGVSQLPASSSLIRTSALLTFPFSLQSCDSRSQPASRNLAWNVLETHPAMVLHALRSSYGPEHRIARKYSIWLMPAVVSGGSLLLLLNAPSCTAAQQVGFAAWGGETV